MRGYQTCSGCGGKGTRISYDYPDLPHVICDDCGGSGVILATTLWTLRSMTQAVRERVLKLAFPDRSPLVVSSGADLFVVCRPDPENHPMTYTRRHLGTLGEEYAQLPVPPWVGIQGDDPWAEAVGQLMLAHEAEEAKKRFLEVLSQ